MAQVTSGTLNTNAVLEGRYYTLSWSVSQSIANNQSTVSWTVSSTGGKTWYAERTLVVKLAGKTLINKTDRVERYAGTINTGSFTIDHNTDGSKSISGSIQAAVYYSTVNATASGSWELKDIPRAATITSAPNFDDEDNPTIKYSNSAGNSVTSLKACISLDGSAADIAYRDISKTGTSYTFNLTDAERTVLRKATTTSNSRTVKFYVQTEIGGNTYRNSVAKTLSIINANPTLNPTVKDTGSTSITLTGDAEGTVIKGYNSMSVSAGAAAKKNATIKSYKITCGGKSITTASGTLGYVESGDFVFSVTDSRGNTTTKTVTKKLINYVKVTCNLSANAPTADGNMKFTIKGNYFNGSFGAVSNTLTVEYRYKTNDGSYGAWTAATATKSGNTYNATVSLTGLNYLNSYTFQARAKDTIYTVNSSEKKVKTIPIFDWGENDFNFNVNVNYQENLIFKNGGVGIRGKTSDGTELQALQPCNSNNNLALGYGGYTQAIGASNIYGNQIKLISNDGVYIDGRKYGNNKVLWSGTYYMTAGHTVTLSEAVSDQPHGIVLIFSEYTGGTAQDSAFNSFFVPKYLVANKTGKGSTFIMSSTNFGAIATKYIYINNTTLTGHANNNGAGTSGTGIKYGNNLFVLRYVIGV